MTHQEKILNRHWCAALDEPELTPEEFEEAKNDEALRPMIEGAIRAMDEWAKEQVNGIMDSI